MGSIAITGCRIVDGTGGAPIENGTIMISGATIQAVGAAGAVAIDPQAQVLDLSGMSVLPGFCDGHMHITQMPGLQGAENILPDTLVAAEHLQQCLLRGTTMVGHAGGSADCLVLRDLINRGALGNKARLCVSEVITATGGHVRGAGYDGPWAIRQAVRAAAARGFDFIKTCATGGFQWAHEGLGHPDYSLEELQALVDEAHARGLTVHAHAHAVPGLANAVEAGCDCILHGAMIDEASLETMAAKHLWYMPTLYITSEHFWGTPGLPAHIADRAKAAGEHHRRGVEMARQMGIRIATGSDGMPRPGAILHELVELVGAGLTPMEAIVSATSHSAALFNLSDTTGTLETGKLADLVAFRGCPDQDISLVTKPEALALVVKEGRIVSRNA